MQMQGRGLGGMHSPPGVLAAQTSTPTMIESASDSHRRAAVSLLEQSEVDGSFPSQRANHGADINIVCFRGRAGVVL